MNITEISNRLGIPPDECGTDSLHAIVHAVRVVELGHAVFVFETHDPRKPGIRTIAEDVATLTKLHRTNPRLGYLMACDKVSGLVGVEFHRECDLRWLSRDFGPLPITAQIEVPNTKRTIKIFSDVPGDPEFKIDERLGNCHARLLSAVPLPGNPDLKSNSKFVWSPGCALGEIALSPLPRKWREGLPKAGITDRVVKRPEFSPPTRRVSF